MKKWIRCPWVWLIIVGLMLGAPSTGFATSTSVDALIKKLVDKGILTEKEALELKGEIAADEKMVREEGYKQSLPSWIQNIAFKGDYRLRFQYERKQNDSEAQARGRMRFRFGIDSKVNDQIKIGVGLATASAGTSGEDPRSTNLSFDNSFQHSEVRLDYAYAEYKPTERLKMAGGKFLKADYLWTTTDLLWDSDINPEGGSVNLKHVFNDSLEGFLNNGVWVMDDYSKTDEPDPFLLYSQAGAKWKNETFDAALAAVYYGFSSVEDNLLSHSACTNTGLVSGSSCTGTLQYDYDAVGSSLELVVLKPLSLPIERLAIFGDFIHNYDPEADDIGWAAGLKFGDKKVAGPGQWQFKYQYSYLGKDAFLDVLPDSDRYSGGTDTAGHETILEYGLNKNVVLSLDYYQDHKIKAAKNPQKLIQADINFKF